MTDETNTPEKDIINETEAVPHGPVIDPNADQVAPSAKPQITIGQLLRNKREERGLNLKTISQQTKIHMGLLEHLENDDLAKLPSKTYVRGFVKSAAKILNINQEEALDALESTYDRGRKSLKVEGSNIEIRNEAVRNTLTTMTSTPLETVKSVTASSSAFLAKAAVVILIVGVVGFNVKNLIDRSAEERMKLPQVLSTIHQRTKSAPKAKPVPAAPKVETAQTEVEPIKVNIIQDKKEAQKASEVTVNDVKLKNISLGEKQFTEDNSLTKEQYDEFLPSRYRVQPGKGVENVFINATEGDSWITYKVDDKEIKKYVLRQGRTVFIRGGLIRLFIGNTKSVRVFYNNKLINLNAKGATKNLVFPEDVKTKYMVPLFIFNKDGSAETSDEAVKKTSPATPAAPATSTTPATPAATHPAQSNLR
jgi:cytoskeleton protein RodZ